MRKWPQYHPEDRGTLFGRVLSMAKVARAVARLHGMGLCHSDLSGNNVFADTTNGRAYVIDCDGLVVPNLDLARPVVVGTPGWMAPELVTGQETMPSPYTERHSLAVIVYQTLLMRHPLFGPSVHDPNDPNRDEELQLGEQALFIESPRDVSNRPKNLAYPYTVYGAGMSRLFERAFVDGLRDPRARPMPHEWARELTRLFDVLVPCENKNCEFKAFPLPETARGRLKVRCPWCATRGPGCPPVAAKLATRPAATARRPISARESLWKSAAGTRGRSGRAVRRGVHDLNDPGVADDDLSELGDVVAAVEKTGRARKDDRSVCRRRRPGTVTRPQGRVDLTVPTDPENRSGVANNLVPERVDPGFLAGGLLPQPLRLTRPVFQIGLDVLERVPTDQVVGNQPREMRHLLGRRRLPQTGVPVHLGASPPGQRPGLVGGPASPDEMSDVLRPAALLEIRLEIRFRDVSPFRREGTVKGRAAGDDEQIPLTGALTPVNPPPLLPRVCARGRRQHRLGHVLDLLAVIPHRVSTSRPHCSGATPPVLPVSSFFPGAAQNARKVGIRARHFAATAVGLGGRSADL
jgi:hypothetical protein